MMKLLKVLFHLLLLFVCANTFAQPKNSGQSYFGAYNYTEYIYGSLPIIIGAPHDGTLTPANIADRTDSTCGGLTVTTARDINVQKVVRSLDTSLTVLFGAHPHTVICKLQRKKLDVNREINEASCGDTTAQHAWNDYMDFMDTAHRAVIANYGRGLFLDFHGHGHSIDRIEIGYLLTGYTLRQSDSYLNQSGIVNVSSVHNLADNNLTAQTHAQLVRGSQAFGTLLGNAGYPSVPSQQIPFPNVADSYFDGGYNTERWASRDSGTIDGFQLETYYTGLRDNTQNIRRFTDSVAVIIKKYLDHIFNPGTLPVTLFSFSGGLKDGVPQLMWQASAEANLKVYIMERSSDGRHFAEAGRVSTNNHHSYSFEDAGYNNGVNYYRLKMLSIDGSFGYSKIISINSKQLETAIFANATANSLTVYHSKAGKNAFLKLFTVSGIMLHIASMKEGSFQTSFDFNRASPANYILMYRNGESMTTRKIFI